MLKCYLSSTGKYGMLKPQVATYFQAALETLEASGSFCRWISISNTVGQCPDNARQF